MRYYAGAYTHAAGNEKSSGVTRRAGGLRAICFIKCGRCKKINTLTDASMKLRREVVEQIGSFDERSGRSMSGISENVEFAKGYLASGGRIGYEPDAVVYHMADWHRLTEKFYRERHKQQGRSRLVFTQQSISLILLNLLRAVVVMGWPWAIQRVHNRYRAKGRYCHYRAILQAKWRDPKSEAA